MKKYALVTEDTPGVWEVFHMVRPPISSTEEPLFVSRLEQAYSNGHEIIGMSVPEQKNLVAAGAVWDGTTFSGGESTINRAEVDYDNIDVYAFLANNVVVFTMIIKKESVNSPTFNAAFGNNVKMIQVDMGQVVTTGYTWDGNNFNPPA